MKTTLAGFWSRVRGDKKSTAEAPPGEKAAVPPAGTTEHAAPDESPPQER